MFLRGSVAQGRLMRVSWRASSTLAKRVESTHRVAVAALASALAPPPPEHDIGCVALASGAVARD